jgi:integrase/recombinase XerD
MKNELQKFKLYLNKQGYSDSTIQNYGKAVDIYIQWTKENNINRHKATYNDVMAYTEHLNGGKLKKITVNRVMQLIKKYYDYLISQNKRTDNPAAEIRIKNIMRTIPQNLLDKEQLEKMYHEYNARGVTGKRNKCILGLMIWQGITSGESMRMMVMDIDLEKANVYIPSVKRSASRKLKLQPEQIFLLQEYIQYIRPIMLKTHKRKTDYLFIPNGTGLNLHNSLFALYTELREQFDFFKDADQIHASVLVLWNKSYNVRQVQYMAGHKYLSSTDRYRTIKLESLQEQLEKIHPVR